MRAVFLRSSLARAAAAEPEARQAAHDDQDRPRDADNLRIEESEVLREECGAQERNGERADLMMHALAYMMRNAVHGKYHMSKGTPLAYHLSKTEEVGRWIREKLKESREEGRMRKCV